MIKIIIVFSFLLMEGFDAFIKHLDKMYIDKELPENVRDVYDEEEYRKWRNYQSESGRFDMVSDGVKIAVNFLLLVLNVYAWLFKAVAVENVFFQYFIVVVLLTLLSSVIAIPFKYYDTFVIEEKYGLNKTTKVTFVKDTIKDFLIASVIMYALIMLLKVIFETFGNLAIIVSTAAVVVIMLILNLIIVPLMRIYNKFTPLEEGELRDKLTDLCVKYGMKVRKIVVKDASRRTTTSNAFCSGYGKLKTISLDDNLVNNFADEEIVAVFAHEFAHAKYKHVIKSFPFAIISMLITFSGLYLVLNIPALYIPFGFEGINFYFAQVLLSIMIWPVTKIITAVSNHISRKHEYQADAFAAEEGYGDYLVSALKRLSKEALSDINPHPIKVVLNYSHPTLSQRIEAIDRINEERVQR